MKQKLFVFLGDVVSSRKIADRDVFQRLLEGICREVNTRYADDLRAPFKTLKGLDEIGGVLTDISNIFNIVAMISDGLHPHQMRCALVYDYVDTALESGDVSKMDGPSFHRAAQAIIELKKTDLLFSLSAEDEALDKAFEGEINLMLLLRRERTSKQRQIIKEYELIKNQQEVARNLGISQQSVSLALRRSRWKLLKGLEDNLNGALRGYQGRIKKGMNGGCMVGNID